MLVLLVILSCHRRWANHPNCCCVLVCILSLRTAEVESAETYVRIDDVAKLLLRDVPKNVTSDQCAEHHAAKTVEVACENVGSEETAAGTKQSHRQVANEEIGRDGGHIALLVGLGRDVVEHSRWALHGEETTHQTAQSAHADLHAAGGAQPDSLVEKGKIHSTYHKEHA